MQRDFALYERMTELNRRAIERPYDAAVRDELAELSAELDNPAWEQMWRTAAIVARQHAGVVQSIPRESPPGGSGASASGAPAAP